MPVSLLYSPLWQITDSNGMPVPLARVYAFAAGTSTPLSLFADANGAVPLPHGVQADGGGRLLAYLAIGQAYKLDVHDANDVQVPGYPVDFVTAVPGASAGELPGHSNTVPEQGLTMDPGEQGAENLADSMAEELEQLRFRISEMTGAPWIATYTSRVLPVAMMAESGPPWLVTDPTQVVPVAITVETDPTRTLPVAITIQADENTTWGTAGISMFNFRFAVPLNWQVGSAMALNLMYHAQATGGAVNMYWSYERYRAGVAPFGSGNTAFSHAITDTNSRSTALNIPGASFLPGDLGLVRIVRDGDQPDDTNTGSLLLDGASFVVEAPQEPTSWPAGGTSAVRCHFAVPLDWESGTALGLNLMYHAQVTGGAVNMYWNYQRMRAGIPIFGSGNVALSHTITDTNSRSTVLTIPASAFLPGDTGMVTIVRQGDELDDTNTGALLLDGANLLVDVIEEQTSWGASGTSLVNFRFYLPPGWQLGSGVALNLVYHAVATGGAVNMYWNWTRIRAGVPIFGSGNTAFSHTITTTNSQSTLLQVPTASFQAGDYGVISVVRQGSQGDDTHTGPLVLDGANLLYTGIGSR